MLPGLSIVMIGRDAGRALADVLRAAMPHADETVFVDTGSRDDTLAIAERAGCRTFQLAWRDDFAFARNTACSYARHAWILSIDTDEVLRTPDARTIIDRAIAADESPAFLVTQDNVYDDGTAKPNLVARLFKNDPRIQFRNPVHECISECFFEHFAIGRLPALDIHLEHRGYAAELIPAKLERNLGILERWERDQPTAFGLFKLGNTLVDLGRSADALPHLDRAYALLATPGARRAAGYLHAFMVVYHRALAAARSQASADEFEAIANEWLRT
ncbi:MAG TPA: glycosyltransferase [Kofleriaceae bacterium]|jgi:glycosyltransferase involved in cell wall biosynthesis